MSHGPPQAYDRGPSDHIGDSDNSNPLQHNSDTTNCRNIDLWGGGLTVKYNGSEWILTNKPFLHHNPWVSTGEGGRIHFDKCITMACYNG